jgi:hypothetical protein
MCGKALRLLLTEYYSAKEVSILLLDGSGDVANSWDEYHTFSIWCSEYNGQLGVVYPSCFPVDLFQTVWQETMGSLGWLCVLLGLIGRTSRWYWSCLFWHLGQSKIIIFLIYFWCHRYLGVFFLLWVVLLEDAAIFHRRGSWSFLLLLSPEGQLIQLFLWSNVCGI